MAVTARHVLASAYRYSSQTPNPTSTALPAILAPYVIADEPSSFLEPPTFVGWTIRPGGRGTIDIISKCFVVLAFCCWSGLHLNIPGPMDLPRTKLVRKIRWAVVAIVIPEAILALAIIQRLDAKNTLKRLKTFEYCKDWHLSHGFFVNMGGFHVATPANGAYVLNVEQFISLLRQGETPPATSEVDLEGLSRSNGLGKAISLFAGTWLLCTTIIRCAENSPATHNPRLPISPLEITSSIFVLCILAAYMCWWHKPYDVQRRIEWNTRDTSSFLDRPTEPKENRVFNTSIDQVLKKEFAAAFSLASFIFGGLHLLVLPAQCSFPTKAEKWMWVGSSAILAFSGPFYILLWILWTVLGTLLLLFMCVRCLTKNSERRKKPQRAAKLKARDPTDSGREYLPYFTVIGIFYSIIIGFFIILRILLLVLALASLRKLDAKVYDTPRWTDYTPFG